LHLFVVEMISDVVVEASCEVNFFLGFVGLLKFLSCMVDCMTGIR
jgi:hypothetical protein